MEEERILGEVEEEARPEPGAADPDPEPNLRDFATAEEFIDRWSEWWDRQDKIDN